jgi:hypothetical protein
MLVFHTIDLIGDAVAVADSASGDQNFAKRGEWVHNGRHRRADLG